MHTAATVFVQDGTPMVVADPPGFIGEPKINLGSWPDVTIYFKSRGKLIELRELIDAYLAETAEPVPAGGVQRAA